MYCRIVEVIWASQRPPANSGHCISTFSIIFSVTLYQNHKTSTDLLRLHCPLLESRANVFAPNDRNRMNMCVLDIERTTRNRMNTYINCRLCLWCWCWFWLCFVIVLYYGVFLHESISSAGPKGHVACTVVLASSLIWCAVCSCMSCEFMKPTYCFRPLRNFALHVLSSESFRMHFPSCGDSYFIVLVSAQNHRIVFASATVAAAAVAGELHTWDIVDHIPGLFTGLNNSSCDKIEFPSKYFPFKLTSNQHSQVHFKRPHISFFSLFFAVCCRREKKLFDKKL